MQSAIGPYEIMERIGAGGMGVVYRARDTRLGRMVALKILPPEDATTEGRRRFVQEARAASSLNHPHIVTIYDIGEAGSVAYIAMELVDGRTLREWIVDGGYSVDEAVAYARQAAGAIARAHDAGILHRDLKPANLMVTPEASIKILDFGLAKRVPPGGASQPGNAATLSILPQTAPGIIAGTPEYMSPEQAQGRPLDKRSDIFSFGVVLYEMLSGRSPFTRDTRIGTLAAILHDTPDPPSGTNPAIPRGLDRVVARCLEKKPSRRYQSMREVADALDGETRPPRCAVRTGVAVTTLSVLLFAAAAPAARMRFESWRAHREPPSPAKALPAPPNPRGAYDLYSQARAALQRYDKPGNIETAITLLRRVIDQEPKYAAAWAGLSEAYWRKYRESKNLADLDEARDLGLRATQLDDRLASAHANLGAIYTATGDALGASREFGRALELDPVHSEALRGLAQALAAQERFTEAEEAFRRAVQLRPGDWMAHTALGTFLTNRGRYPDAEGVFQEAARLEPDNAIALGNLASIHLSLRDYDRAAAEAQRAIQAQATPSAYLMLANVRFEQGLYREAAEWNEKAAALTGDKSYTTLGNLADSYRWTPEFAAKAPGTYRRAIEVAGRALATNPRNGYAWSCRALYSAKLGDMVSARNDIRKALELAPKDVRVLVNSVTVYELVKQRPRALEQLALASRSGYPEESILHDPELASLRGAARN